MILVKGHTFIMAVTTLLSEIWPLKLRISQLLWERLMGPLDIYDKLIRYYGQSIQYASPLEVDYCSRNF